MLSIIIDIGGGYLVARYVRNLWLAILAAVVIGAVSAVVANLLIYAFSSDVFTPGEIVLRIASGIILHPIVAIVSLLIFRRKIVRIAKENPVEEGEKA